MTQRKAARKAAVIESHKNGMTIKEIAHKYGISVSTIKGYLREERIRKEEERITKQKARIAERTEAIIEDTKDGLSAMEVAKKEDTSYSTVLNTLKAYRTSQVSPDILYKELTMIAERKGAIREWMKKQVGSTVNTPDGQMFVTAVYPYIVECLEYGSRRKARRTYTHGEIYYTNRR